MLSVLLDLRSYRKEAVLVNPGSNTPSGAKIARLRPSEIEQSTLPRKSSKIMYIETVP